MKRLASLLSAKPVISGCTYLCATLFATLLSLPTLALASCPQPGQWWQAQAPLTNSELLAIASQQQVVLLGEQHDSLTHHRWQLHTLAGLHALRDDMVIGLEMLPRSVQPALDAWVAGEIDAPTLLEQTRWDDVWGFDPDLYMPILAFAKMAQIPLIALNIDVSLRQRLMNDGWETVSAEERYAIPQPHPASKAYQTRLTDVFNQHDMGDDPEMLERFIQAQLTWDVAMAQRLAEAAEGGGLAVGLMGLGHITYNDGVPHQLAGIGIERTLSLLPWQQTLQNDCTQPEPGLADAVFVLKKTRADE